MSILLRSFLLLIVLSGLIHIIAILTTPFFAEKKVWQNITSSIPEKQMMALTNYSDIINLLGQADPSMAYGICWFSLKDGPVTILAEGPTSFWNVTLYNDKAEAIYSLHNEVSESNLLNLEVRQRGFVEETDLEETLKATPETSSNIPAPSLKPDIVKEETEQDDEQLIRANVSEDNTFAVLKLFKSSRHYQKLIQETFEDAECR